MQQTFLFANLLISLGLLLGLYFILKKRDGSVLPVWKEKCANLEKQIDDLKHQLENSCQDNFSLCREVKIECERRSIAEEKNTHLQK